ncbi:MAG: hypothetical protein EAX81_00620 [Candidatus Thorarchaeota archaeon]|nr:hypothetical protein [Candidatus Thorarchaeota archaeon]
MSRFPSGSDLVSFLRSDRESFATKDYSTLSNEQFLFILNAFSGVAPYSHEFVAVSQDTQVLSGLISALTSFMQEITGTRRTHWKTEYGSDTTLIVEEGEWAMGVLVVKKETSEARSKLRRIVREFEDSFAILREADGFEGSAFRDFDQFVRRLFVADRLSNRAIILKGYDWRENFVHCESPRWSYNIKKLLTQIEDRMTLSSAMQLLEVSFEEITELISRALWNRFIHVVFVPPDDDILMLSEESGSFLLDMQNPKKLRLDTLKVIGSLNNRTKLIHILRKLKLDSSETLMIELGLLTNGGYIQRVTLERKLVLVNECILTMMLKRASNLLDAKSIRNYFNLAIERTVAQIPWATRIECSRGFKITCRLEEALEIRNLLQLSDALESIQKDLANQVSQKLGSATAERISKEAMTSCLEVWSSSFEDLVV